jgi:crossover junction endodeoxyribonuclease RuvC
MAMRILGIDPGSANTGYGIVERVKGRISYVAHGTIRAGSTAPLSERLAGIQRGLRAAISEHGPECAVVERVFVSNNPRSALVLGHARGAILATLGELGLQVEELAAREIKKAITGTGTADKKQVQAMVCRLLALERPPAQDAADALAAAMCRAQMGRLAALGPLRGRARSRSRRAIRPVPGGIGG